MFAARTASMMLMGALLATLSACATTHGRLTDSADRLQQDADAFAGGSRYSASDYRNADFTRDARALADRAEEFRRTVDDPRAGNRDVKDAFDQLSRSYHTLRDDVDRSDSRQARADLRPVTHDYLNVEGAMEGYPTHDRYAEAPDRNERY